MDASFASLHRVSLQSGAWIDRVSRWCRGDDRLFEVLKDAGEWESPEVVMFERKVTTPRLTTRVDPTWHHAIAEMVTILSDRYGRRLDRVSAALYRDGQDSVAWHGDRIARDLPEATVATVSLGAPRRFLYKPALGGDSESFSLGGGDLVVMGGSFQRTWRHCVPKTTRAAGPRIALMFRHAYEQDR